MQLAVSAARGMAAATRHMTCRKTSTRAAPAATDSSNAAGNATTTHSAKA